MTSTNATKSSAPIIKLFGEEVPVTKRRGVASNTPRATTVKKLILRREKDIVCVLTSEFDGMIDGARSTNEEVSVAWVIKNMLDSERSTRNIWVSGQTLVIHDAVYSVDVRSKVAVEESKRRAEALKSLPLIMGDVVVAGGFNMRGRYDGVAETTKHTANQLRALRELALSKIPLDDGMTFDEAIEEFRSLGSAPDSAYAVAMRLLTVKLNEYMVAA
jgi:hypothetical protein